MKILYALMFASSIAVAAEELPPIRIVPQEDGSVIFILPKEVVRECGKQGGCNIVSARQIDAYLKRIKPQLCGELEI